MDADSRERTVAQATDSDLMTQVREGRVAALGELFERHHVAVFRFCLRMTGNRGTSEDLVQDVFTRILKHRKGFRPHTAFLPWMYRIAHNACVDHLRRSTRAPQPAEDLDSRPADLTPTDEHNGVRMAGPTLNTLTIVDGLLSRELPVDRREVLLLSRYELKSYEEIAEALGITVNNVKIRAHRAIKQLREVCRELAREVTP